MYGLVNRSLENFLRGNYGDALWRRIVEDLDIEGESFETMLIYEDALTHALVDAAAARLGKPRTDILEDFGTYLVADRASRRVRRLLRFGGIDYGDFLHSLDELRGRTRLALPDLDFPQLELNEVGDGQFTLVCKQAPEGFGHVMLGVLRALADDYGALVFLEHLGREGEAETLSINLLDAGFAEDRGFSLAQEAV